MLPIAQNTAFVKNRDGKGKVKLKRIDGVFGCDRCSFTTEDPVLIKAHFDAQCPAEDSPMQSSTAAAAEDPVSTPSKPAPPAAAREIETTFPSVLDAVEAPATAAPRVVAEDPPIQPASTAAASNDPTTVTPETPTATLEAPTAPETPTLALGAPALTVLDPATSTPGHQEIAETGNETVGDGVEEASVVDREAKRKRTESPMGTTISSSPPIETTAEEKRRRTEGDGGVLQSEYGGWDEAFNDETLTIAQNPPSPVHQALTPSSPSRGFLQLPVEVWKAVKALRGEYTLGEEKRGDATTKLAECLNFIYRQQQAVLLAILPLSADVSLLYKVSGVIRPTKVTIIIKPIVQDPIMTIFNQSLPANGVRWEPMTRASTTANLVLASFKDVESSSFNMFINNLIATGRLEMMVLEEVHCILREPLEIQQKIATIICDYRPKTLLISNHLTREYERELQMALNYPIGWTVIRAESTMNLELQVNAEKVKDATHLGKVGYCREITKKLYMIEKRLQKGVKGIIVAKDSFHATGISESLKLPLYSSVVKNEKGEMELKSWVFDKAEEGRFNALVGVSGKLYGLLPFISSIMSIDYIIHADLPTDIHDYLFETKHARGIAFLLTSGSRLSQPAPKTLNKALQLAYEAMLELVCNKRCRTLQLGKMMDCNGRECLVAGTGLCDLCRAIYSDVPVATVVPRPPRRVPQQILPPPPPEEEQQQVGAIPKSMKEGFLALVKGYQPEKRGRRDAGEERETGVVEGEEQVMQFQLVEVGGAGNKEDEDGHSKLQFISAGTLLEPPIQAPTRTPDQVSKELGGKTAQRQSKPPTKRHQKRPASNAQQQTNPPPLPSKAEFETLFEDLVDKCTPCFMLKREEYDHQASQCKAFPQLAITSTFRDFAANLRKALIEAKNWSGCRSCNIPSDLCPKAKEKDDTKRAMKKCPYPNIVPLALSTLVWSENQDVVGRLMGDVGPIVVGNNDEFFKWLVKAEKRGEKGRVAMRIFNEKTNNGFILALLAIAEERKRRELQAMKE